MEENREGNMHPDTVCWGDGEQIEWTEFKKMRAKEARTREDASIEDKDGDNRIPRKS